MRLLPLFALAAALTAQNEAQKPTPAATTPVTPPKTTPEATDHQRTSTVAEVAQFLSALPAMPHGDRIAVRTVGKSKEGRDLQLVRCALPGSDEKQLLRALVIANIHAGEVEGKEAVQAIAREFAAGDHEDLLRRAVVYLLPIYNPDGNERFGDKNRPEQNGPDSVGARPNGMGLDLNRDFVKAEAPETRALLALFQELDPHLFMDLHTTDGSWHGYQLTYAPSLSPNVDPGVADLSRAVLDDVTTAMRGQSPSYATFDYGNFETRDWDGSGAPESKAGVRGWWSYDHRARYGINYFGLRNRIAILSEAYSNCDFATRIAATRSFVLGVLRSVVARRDEVVRVAAAADEALTSRRSPTFFGFDTVFGDPEQIPVLVGDCERVPLPGDRGTRFVRKDVATPETMPVHRRFCARRQRELPVAWVLPSPPAAVVELLAAHGVVTTTTAAPQSVHAARFEVAKKRKPKAEYQGHRELVLDGSWTPAAAVDLPAGTLWVAADQRLARVAAQLLEPESEDSLSSWNFLEAATDTTYPVLRIERGD